MQFSAVTFIAFVVTGVVAAPAADEIFCRANCNDILAMEAPSPVRLNADALAKKRLAISGTALAPLPML
ncbi:hypothetical protein IFR04_006992 [Cadophora malorum]|uniref:Uncharacterized protein n=1 Tax=Cadophora malorum TaxID=108018 RepID=A0A8H7W7C7_9HELO|nr:hypothetical protein IFR04_006992 [Cadophora malorum]